MSRSRISRFSGAATVTAALIAAPLTPAAPAAHAVVGAPAADNAHGFTATLVIGEHQRGCSGSLVNAEWLLTAASCFVDDPALGLDVAEGAPPMKVTATIGRPDLTTSAGHVRSVVELVPRTDRDVVLARLSAPVQDVVPVKLAADAPVGGESLTAAGYGRTADDWAPTKLHTGTFTTAAASGSDLPVTGQDGASICAGDTGGPLLRGAGPSAVLVAVSSRSAQAGCFGIDETQTSTDGVSVRVDDIASWVTSKINEMPVADFNGDGVEDIAIADAKASVGGGAGAGLVRLVYGGGKGTEQIDQDLDWVPGAAEAGDGFGSAIDTVDYDQDGYTDLVVGTPGEDLDGNADAGMVDVLYGSPDGLGSGDLKNKHLEQGQGTGALAGVASEADDRMGAALAAGTAATGRSWIVIGTPGEANGTLAESGVAYYVYDDTSRILHQDLPTEVPGVSEAGDKFGAAVTGDENFFAIGAPGETVETASDSGTVALFSHTLETDGRPTTIGGMDQNNDAVTGAAEAGDEFGAALAMTAYRTSGSATADSSMLVIGSPGETTAVDGTDRVDAGRAVLVQIDSKGAWNYVRELRQADGTDTVAGTSESGDRMGESLTAINTAPHQVATAATLKVAVGTPGEAAGSAAEAGAIHTFSMIGAAGDNDLWIEAGDGDGIPGAPTAGHRLGESIHFTGTQLYAGMPYGPVSYGSLYALPMGNTYPGGTDGPVTTYQPGTGGLPAAGSQFGSAAR